jgi:hypothetical protein
MTKVVDRTGEKPVARELTEEEIEAIANAEPSKESKELGRLLDESEGA